MSTQKAINANVQRNTGMTILKAGAISSNSPVTKNITQLSTVSQPISYGTKVALSSGSAFSSGNLGTFNSFTNFAYKQTTGTGRWLMPKVASYINGVTISAAMRGWANGASSSAENMRAIPYIESARSLGSGVSTSWNYLTGAITKGVGAGESRSFGQDHTSRPTNAVPGELTYRTGAKLATTDDYKPKTAP